MNNGRNLWTIFQVTKREGYSKLSPEKLKRRFQETVNQEVEKRFQKLLTCSALAPCAARLKAYQDIISGINFENPGDESLVRREVKPQSFRVQLHLNSLPGEIIKRR